MFRAEHWISSKRKFSLTLQPGGPVDLGASKGAIVPAARQQAAPASGMPEPGDWSAVHVCMQQ